MPRKFSCRQLRETGQRFENFLVEKGLDSETDREKLRTIYNQDFKIRYGPAHSPALRASATPAAGPPFPPRGAESLQLPPAVAAPAGPGAAQTSPPALPTPRPRRPEPARPLCRGRAAAPRPGAEPPAQPLLPRRPGPGRGPAATHRLGG